MTAHPGALKAIASGIAESCRPRPPKPFSEWIRTNIELVDGPKKGELWSPEDAPYLVEVAECLSIENPCTEVSVRKAQQTGVSILALAWCLYLAEVAPDNILYGVPGLDALRDINSGKLQRLIDKHAERTGKTTIFPVKDRSGTGSTASEKKFAGGSLYMANANAVMDLSAKTIRYGVEDELSKWSTLPNGADPENLFFGRFTAFRRLQEYKIFRLSTPEIDSGNPAEDAPGHCRIDRHFQRSDQRYWHVKCPACGKEQVLNDKALVVDRDNPERSTLRCQHCPHEITEAERVDAVRGGRWIATKPGPGRHPGFHIDAFISLMMSIGEIVKDKKEYAKKGEAGEKDYANVVCALPFAPKGNAPDHKRLMERREDYQPETIPPGALIFTIGADIQSYGIYAEAVAFAEDRQSWNVSAEFFEGATDNPQAGAWLLFEEYIGREFPDAWGVLWRPDAIAVDSGYRTNQVLEFCRRHPGTYATKGEGKRGVPAISPPTRKSVTRKGKRKRYGSSMSWPVGTWALKQELMGNLHKTGIAAGEVCDPPGYTHFHKELGEEYFQQLTSEYFKQTLANGRLHEEWAQRREHNHWLDCRIGAMAMAEMIGLTRMKPEEWAALRARRMPAPEMDLLSPAPVRVQAPVTPDKLQPAAAKAEKPRVNRWASRS